MNKGNVSDIKPGMLVQIEVSSGPDKGIVFAADTYIFTVMFLDNSGENLPVCIGADEIVCAWDISQLPTYVVSDLLGKGEYSSFRPVIENCVVYQNTKTENMEMTLEEISEIVSKHLGKSVSVSVKESESCESECDKTEDETNDYSEPVRVEVAVGDCIKHDGITYRCVEDVSISCIGCAFLNNAVCVNVACCADNRADRKYVHFVKQDVTEPVTEVFVVPEDGVIDHDAQIGEELEIEGVRYRAVEDTRSHNGDCGACALKADGVCGYYEGLCGSLRKDGKSILFERVPAEDACKSSDTADGQKPLLLRKNTQSPTIEPAIGDLIVDNGKKLKVVENEEGCTSCYFCNGDCRHIICFSGNRKDKKSIILQEVKEEE